MVFLFATSIVTLLCAFTIQRQYVRESFDAYSLHIAARHSQHDPIGNDDGEDIARRENQKALYRCE